MDAFFMIDIFVNFRTAYVHLATLVIDKRKVRVGHQRAPQERRAQTYRGVGTGDARAGACVCVCGGGVLCVRLVPDMHSGSACSTPYPLSYRVCSPLPSLSLLRCMHAVVGAFHHTTTDRTHVSEALVLDRPARLDPVGSRLPDHRVGVWR